jgi:hypothetical protein
MTRYWVDIRHLHSGATVAEAVHDTASVFPSRAYVNHVYPGRFVTDAGVGRCPSVTRARAVVQSAIYQGDRSDERA